ncbi:MAG: hypothetical protein HN666_04660 [Candidatus Peribacter sp.]|nr:hypothetical protein [Candidatus Peribacter sp.]
MHAFLGKHGQKIVFFAVVTGMVFVVSNQNAPTSLQGNLGNYTIECGAELANVACGDVDALIECCDDGSDPVDGYCIDASADGGECENDGAICWVGTCRGGKCENKHSYCNRDEECDAMGACLPVDFCEKNPGSSDCCTEVDGVEGGDPEVAPAGHHNCGNGKCCASCRRSTSGRDCLADCQGVQTCIDRCREDLDHWECASGIDGNDGGTGDNAGISGGISGGTSGDTSGDTAGNDGGTSGNGPGSGPGPTSSAASSAFSSECTTFDDCTEEYTDCSDPCFAACRADPFNCDPTRARQCVLDNCYDDAQDCIGGAVEECEEVCVGAGECQDIKTDCHSVCTDNWCLSPLTDPTAPCTVLEEERPAYTDCNNDCTSDYVACFQDSFDCPESGPGPGPGPGEECTFCATADCACGCDTDACACTECPPPSPGPGPASSSAASATSKSSRAICSDCSEEDCPNLESLNLIFRECTPIECICQYDPIQTSSSAQSIQSSVAIQSSEGGGNSSTASSDNSSSSDGGFCCEEDFCSPFGCEGGTSLNECLTTCGVDSSASSSFSSSSRKGGFCCEVDFCSPFGDCDSPQTLEECVESCGVASSSSSSTVAFELSSSASSAECLQDDDCANSCSECRLVGDRCILECEYGICTDGKCAYGIGEMLECGTEPPEPFILGDGVLNRGCDASDDSSISSTLSIPEPSSSSETSPSSSFSAETSSSSSSSFSSSSSSSSSETSSSSSSILKTSPPLSSSPEIASSRLSITISINDSDDSDEDSTSDEDDSSTDEDDSSDDDGFNPSFCGNGTLEQGEQCEVGSTNYCTTGRTCNASDCTCYPAAPLLGCGNGTLEQGEQCEVGSTNYCTTGRTCNTAICTCVPPGGSLVAAASVCGNGSLELPEECDDNNRRDNDGCNSTCLLEIGICGDGITQSLLGEQCESSSHNPALSYSCEKCRYLSTTCGDSVVDAGEECDDGAKNSTSPDALCRPNCSLARCGDGVLDNAEICDDGNRLSGDGCDRFCRIEKDSQDEEETVVASDIVSELELRQQPITENRQLPTRYGFPQQPSFQQLPYQLPYAQLQPLIQTQGPIGDTGPAAVAVIGAGAAAGLSWMRRKRK